MKPTRLLGGLFLACLFVTAVSAADVAAPDTLDGIKAKYETGRKAIDAAFEQQKTDAYVAYGKGLDDAKEAAKKKGDLDAYLAIDKARTDFAGSRAVSEATTSADPAVMTVLNQCRKSVQFYEADRNRKREALLDRYIAVLQDAVKRQTILNRIDEAKKLFAELEIARSSKAADSLFSVPATTKPAAPPVAAETAPPDTANRMISAFENGAPRSQPRGNGHFGTPVPVSTETLRMRGTGSIEAWKPTTIAVKSNDWVSVRIVSSTKNNLLTFRKGSTSGGYSSDLTNYRAPAVSLKAKGASCTATESVQGVFCVSEDGVLSCSCLGDANVVATVTITRDDPGKSVWIPD
jgi:hypothetical protein